MIAGLINWIIIMVYFSILASDPDEGSNSEVRFALGGEGDVFATDPCHLEDQPDRHHQCKIHDREMKEKKLYVGNVRTEDLTFHFPNVVDNADVPNQDFIMQLT